MPKANHLEKRIADKRITRCTQLANYEFHDNILNCTHYRCAGHKAGLERELQNFHTKLHTDPTLKRLAAERAAGKQPDWCFDDGDTMKYFEPGADAIHELPIALSEFIEAKPVIIRCYALRGVELKGGLDEDGRADPFIQATLGNYKIQGDSEGRIEMTTNPPFRQMFEFQTNLPGGGKLKLETKDWDQFSFDEPMGETVLDLEDRWFSHSWKKVGVKSCSDILRDLWLKMMKSGLELTKQQAELKQAKEQDLSLGPIMKKLSKAQLKQGKLQRKRQFLFESLAQMLRESLIPLDDKTELLEKFEEVDKQGDNSLDTAEFQAVLQKMNTPEFKAKGVYKRWFAESMDASEDGASAVQKQMEALDADGDGLSKKEFLGWIVAEGTKVAQLERTLHGRGFSMSMIRRLKDLFKEAIEAGQENVATGDDGAPNLGNVMGSEIMFTNLKAKLKKKIEKSTFVDLFRAGGAEQGAAQGAEEGADQSKPSSKSYTQEKEVTLEACDRLARMLRSDAASVINGSSPPPGPEPAPEPALAFEDEFADIGLASLMDLKQLRAEAVDSHALVTLIRYHILCQRCKALNMKCAEDGRPHIPESIRLEKEMFEDVLGSDATAEVGRNAAPLGKFHEDENMSAIDPRTRGPHRQQLHGLNHLDISSLRAETFAEVVGPSLHSFVFTLNDLDACLNEMLQGDEDHMAEIKKPVRAFFRAACPKIDGMATVSEMASIVEAFLVACRRVSGTLEQDVDMASEGDRDSVFFAQFQDVFTEQLVDLAPFTDASARRLKEALKVLRTKKVPREMMHQLLSGSHSIANVFAADWERFSKNAWESSFDNLQLNVEKKTFQDVDIDDDQHVDVVEYLTWIASVMEPQHARGKESLVEDANGIGFEMQDLSTGAHKVNSGQSTEPPFGELLTGWLKLCGWSYKGNGPNLPDGTTAAVRSFVGKLLGAEAINRWFRIKEGQRAAALKQQAGPTNTGEEEEEGGEGEEENDGELDMFRVEPVLCPTPFVATDKLPVSWKDEIGSDRILYKKLFEEFLIDMIKANCLEADDINVEIKEKFGPYSIPGYEQQVENYGRFLVFPSEEKDDGAAPEPIPWVMGESAGAGDNPELEFDAQARKALAQMGDPKDDLWRVLAAPSWNAFGIVYDKARVETTKGGKSKYESALVKDNKIVADYQIEYATKLGSEYPETKGLLAAEQKKQSEAVLKESHTVYLPVDQHTYPAQILFGYLGHLETTLGTPEYVEKFTRIFYKDSPEWRCVQNPGWRREAGLPESTHDNIRMGERLAQEHQQDLIMRMSEAIENAKEGQLFFESATNMSKEEEQGRIRTYILELGEDIGYQQIYDKFRGNGGIDVVNRAPQAGGSRGFFDPLGASPDPLKELLYTLSLGNRYINSCVGLPHTRPLRRPGREVVG
jgi:hypothetical protein